MALISPQFAQAKGGLDRYFSGYYIANFLFMASYYLVRTYFFAHGNPRFSRLEYKERLIEWEYQALGSLGLMMTIKWFRKQSVDHWLADLILFGKVVLLYLSYLADVRIFCSYVILCMLMFMLFQQPVYEGPNNVEYMMPSHFEDDVLHSEESMTWLVTFYAPWASACVYLEPVLAELSLKYSAKYFKFAKVDVSRFPDLAKKHRISVAGGAAQLPTIILFEGGVETARIPHVYSDGSHAKGKFRRQDIVKGFDLDMRVTRSRNKEAMEAAAKKSAQRAAQKPDKKGN